MAKLPNYILYKVSNVVITLSCSTLTVSKCGLQASPQNCCIIVHHNMVYYSKWHCRISPNDIMGDKLLLNFGAKFQR